MSDFSDSDVRNAVAFVPEQTAVMEFSEREAEKFDRWLADHDRRIKAEAWWNGVNDQWKHRPIGNRMSEFDNPYREVPNAE